MLSKVLVVFITMLFTASGYAQIGMPDLKLVFPHSMSVLKICYESNKDLRLQLQTSYTNFLSQTKVDWHSKIEDFPEEFINRELSGQVDREGCLKYIKEVLESKKQSQQLAMFYFIWKDLEAQRVSANQAATVNNKKTSSGLADFVANSIKGEIDTAEEVGVIYQISATNTVLVQLIMGKCQGASKAESIYQGWIDRNFEYDVTVSSIIGAIFDEQTKKTIAKNLQKSVLHTSEKYLENQFTSEKDCAQHLGFIEKGEFDLTKYPEFRVYLDRYRKDAVEAYYQTLKKKH